MILRCFIHFMGAGRRGGGAYVDEGGGGLLGKEA